MNASSNTQNRRSGRSPVLLSAKIDVDGVEISVVLRNLSSEGALIEGAKLPAEGDTTRFRRNDLSVTGRIVWVEGRFAGLAFDRQLERGELLCHVPPKRQQIKPEFRRPGLACQPLTDAERKLLQIWMTESPHRE